MHNPRGWRPEKQATSSIQMKKSSSISNRNSNGARSRSRSRSPSRSGVKHFPTVRVAGDPSTTSNLSASSKWKGLPSQTSSRYSNYSSQLLFSPSSVRGDTFSTYSPTLPNNPNKGLSSVTLKALGIDKASVEVSQDVERARKAIRDGHVFEIRGWANAAVRQYFLQRGWLEKKPKVYVSPTPSATSAQVHPRVSENLVILCPEAQKLLDKRPANYIWGCYTGHIAWNSKLNHQICNRHPQGGFAAKKFVVGHMQQLHWLGDQPGTTMSAFPRSYRLYYDEEKQVFAQDFKLTACLSLLKWFVSERPEGETVLPLVDFALAQVRNYIRVRRHEDIDDGGKYPVFDPPLINWGTYLLQSGQLIQGKKQGSGPLQVKSLKKTVSANIKAKITAVKEALVDVQQFWPQYHMDGMRNVWIFKPANGTRGQGIIVMNNYEDILVKFLIPETQSAPFWMVQKYIERPLLVHNTKFDIRQWFIVASWQPLIAWIYRKCYVRFSGQVFNLEDMDESIHLTNHLVQHRYKIDPNRHPALPSDNMWDSDQFQLYLKHIGRPAVWEELIYPGMKKAILTILLSARESMVHRQRCYHMQGADFMISDDFQPYLIEINATPVMANTTSVTTKLCPQCCRDCIKVALDWDENSKNTVVGDFELFYNGKTKIPTLPKTSPEYIVEGRTCQN